MEDKDELSKKYSVIVMGFIGFSMVFGVSWWVGDGVLNALWKGAVGCLFGGVVGRGLSTLIVYCLVTSQRDRILRAKAIEEAERRAKEGEKKGERS